MVVYFNESAVCIGYWKHQLENLISSVCTYVEYGTTLKQVDVTVDFYLSVQY